MSGKGSKRRPQKVSNKQFADNWDKIFGKKKPDVKDIEDYVRTPVETGNRFYKDKK